MAQGWVVLAAVTKDLLHCVTHACCMPAQGLVRAEGAVLRQLSGSAAASPWRVLLKEGDDFVQVTGEGKREGGPCCGSCSVGWSLPASAASQHGACLYSRCQERSACHYTWNVLREHDRSCSRQPHCAGVQQRRLLVLLAAARASEQ